MRRSLVSVALVSLVAAGAGMIACAADESGPSLSPQPLPPDDRKAEEDPSPSPEEKGDNGGGSSGASSGTPASTETQARTAETADERAPPPKRTPTARALGRRGRGRRYAACLSPQPLPPDDGKGSVEGPGGELRLRAGAEQRFVRPAHRGDSDAGTSPRTDGGLSTDGDGGDADRPATQAATAADSALARVDVLLEHARGEVGEQPVGHAETTREVARDVQHDERVRLQVAGRARPSPRS